MIIAAPGKLVLTGAYAVLEGAPAIVVAVDRLAIADAERSVTATTREVKHAFGTAPAPHVDVSSLYEGTRKLGLGSSAASLVAALAAKRAARFECLAAAHVRRELFREAREAHAHVQGGGSGVDIAASVYGGALRYTLSGSKAAIEAIKLPQSLHLAAFYSGTPARTSDLLGAVAALRARDPRLHRECLDDLRSAAEYASSSISRGLVDSFLMAVQATRRGLAKLARAAEAPIVPLAFAELAGCAAMMGGAFLPSGAGGGDIGVFLGKHPPSEELEALAARRGMKRLPIAIDHEGVRVIASSLQRRAS